MGDETAYLIVQPSGENSARHDKACTHTAPAGNTTTPPPPTRPDMNDVTAHLIVQPSGENSARHDKTRAHAQPERPTTTANNDNADSTSQMNKSRESMQ